MNPLTSILPRSLAQSEAFFSARLLPVFGPCVLRYGGYISKVRKILLLSALLVLPGCTQPSTTPSERHSRADTQFARLAEDYISGYLAWRPQTGTALGFHQYDGKVTDFSRASLAAEVARLKD